MLRQTYPFETMIQLLRRVIMYRGTLGEDTPHSPRERWVSAQKSERLRSEHTFIGHDS